jgi:hypothetical protein
MLRTHGSVSSKSCPLFPLLYSIISFVAVSCSPLSSRLVGLIKKCLCYSFGRNDRTCSAPLLPSCRRFCFPSSCLPDEENHRTSKSSSFLRFLLERNSIDKKHIRFLKQGYCEKSISPFWARSWAFSFSTRTSSGFRLSKQKSYLFIVKLCWPCMSLDAHASAVGIKYVHYSITTACLP